jgi:signal transduction histidine kinase
VLSPQTLRGRLTLAYASALVIALIAFAALVLAVLDRTQRRSLDAQLATTARAVAALVEPSDRTVALDVTDRSQFNAVVGAKVSSAIFRRDGTPAISSIYDVPNAIKAGAMQTRGETFATLRIGHDDVRAFSAPVVIAGRRVGAVAVWREAESIGALDRSIALAFALAIPLVAALAVLAGSAIARRGLAPLDRIATLASEIEAHDLAERLDLPPRGDELGRLAATFDRMLDRLQHAFDRERRFTSDASHELRAPLSVIRAEADLALRRERAPAEYRAALETIAAEADRLEALTRDLLAAARADAATDGAATNGGAAGGARTAVDIAALVTAAAARLRVLAEARAVRIEVDAAPGAAVLGAAAELERALVTVLHNAVKYAPEHGRVEVRVARANDDDGDGVDGADVVEVTVADDGPGFSATGLERAFDRFWRAEETRSRPGTGLGLAIAKTIVERWGGTIAIANGARGGALVTLRFPAQPPGGASSS